MGSSLTSDYTITNDIGHASLFAYLDSIQGPMLFSGKPPRRVTEILTGIEEDNMVLSLLTRYRRVEPLSHR